MGAWLFHLLRLSRLIWVRTALISGLAVVAAAVSPMLARLLPDQITESITLEMTQRLLDILSTTMLTVTTFSLTVLTAAHLTAAQTITPRIHRLLREDSRTQTVLATFMGAFVYALVTTVLLNLRIHEREDFGTVYLFTVAVIALVIIAVLRWIQHLTTLGALDASIALIEAETEAAIRRWTDAPCLGGHRAEGPPPASAVPLLSPGFGFLQAIDMPALSKLADRHGGSLYLVAMPGDYLARDQSLAHLSGGLATDAPLEELAQAFIIGETRTYTHDPVYGLIVMSEIASRALSPAINDPRTAEMVALHLYRMLALAADIPEPDDPAHPWLHAPAIMPDTLFRVAFDPIARDGREFVEVHLRLQDLLARLADHSAPAFAAAARAAATRTLDYAQSLPRAEDIARVRARMPAPCVCRPDS